MKGVMSHIGTNLPIRGTHASNMRKSIIGHQHHPIRRLLASRMGFPVGTGLSSVTSGLSGGSPRRVPPVVQKTDCSILSPMWVCSGIERGNVSGERDHVLLRELCDRRLHEGS